MYAEEIFCALDLNGTGKQQQITVVSYFRRAPLNGISRMPQLARREGAIMGVHPRDSKSP